MHFIWMRGRMAKKMGWSLWSQGHDKIPLNQNHDTGYLTIMATPTQPAPLTEKQELIYRSDTLCGKPAMGGAAWSTSSEKSMSDGINLRLV